MSSNRRKRGGGPPAPAPTTADGAAGIDPDVALFASYMKSDAQRERDAKSAARRARQEAEAVQNLVAAKDAAAAEVKRLRGRDGVSAEQRAAADAAYKAALAAVVAAETGVAPAWAPPPPEPEPEAETETETETEATAGPGADGPDTGAEPVAEEPAIDPT